MNKKLKSKLPQAGFWIMVLTAVVGVVVRIIQLFCATDYTTGFYKSHYSVAMLSIVLWIGLPLSMIVALVGRRDGLSKNYTEKKSKIITVFMVITGALFAVEAMGKIFTLIFFAVTKAAGGYTALTDYLLIVLLAASCAAFLVAAKDNRKGKCVGFYMIIPTLYMAVKLMITFMELTTIANISENLLNILSLGSATLFLCTFAKVAMGISGKLAQSALVVSSFCTAVFGIIYALPHYVLSAANMLGTVYIGNFESRISSLNPEELAVTLFAFVFIGIYFKRRKGAVSEEKPAEEICD